MRAADAVLFYTDREVSEYQRFTEARDRRPFGALNNGVNLDKVRQHRRPYAASARGREILFIGRLTEKAGLDLLLEALSKPDIPQDVRLHVIGNGSTEIALRIQAADLGLADRLTWYGPTVDEALIANVANRCRAFVYPGEVGLSLIHALAYGLPAVVHNEPRRHMPEIAAFAEDQTGRTFHVGDSGSLAQVLAALLDDTSSLDRYSGECLSLTESSFNTQDMAQRFAALVERLAGGETVK